MHDRGEVLKAGLRIPRHPDPVKSESYLKLFLPELAGREFCLAFVEIDVIAQVKHYKIGFVDIIGGRIEMRAPGSNTLPVGLVHAQVDILPLDGGS